MSLNLSLPQILKLIGAVSLALITLSALPTAASPAAPAVTPFCACCAEPGVWSLETREIRNDYPMNELNRLNFQGEAGFYGTEAWPGDVSGGPAPEQFEWGDFIVSIVREQRDWKLFFKTSKGEKGALVLTMPGTATFFDADIEQRAIPERKAVPVVYKEVRLEGNVRGTGVFAKGIAPGTRFRLVLQGKGNMCLSAENFHRWNLRISGPKAKYTIYGFFAKPSP